MMQFFHISRNGGIKMVFSIDKIPEKEILHQMQIISQVQWILLHLFTKPGPEKLQIIGKIVVRKALF